MLAAFILSFRPSFTVVTRNDSASPRPCPLFCQLYLEASLQNHGHSRQELFQHHGQIASRITRSAGADSPRPFQNTVEALELGLKPGFSPLKVQTGNKYILK